MAKREKKPPEPEAGAPLWMVTYGDFMGLLLTFFILLVSMSSIQDTKFKQAIESFRLALEWFEGSPPYPRLDLDLEHEGADRTENKDPQIPTEEKKPAVSADDIIRIAREMQTKINQLNIGGQIQVYYNSKEARIYLDSAIIFEPDSAEIRGREAQFILENVLDLVIEIPYPLIIEGYCSIPSAGIEKGSQSSWELSSTRALVVLHYLNNNGVSDKRLKTVAYGCNTPKKATCIPQERWNNDRVEIVIRDTNIE